MSDSHHTGNPSGEAKCPFNHGQSPKVAGAGTSNQDWWPNQLNLNALRQHSNLSNPLGSDFNYAQEFKNLDLNALKQDIIEVMTLHKIGGLQITVITDHFLSVWLGIAREPTVHRMVAVEQALECNDLLH